MMARPPSLIVLGILALCIAVVSGCGKQLSKQSQLHPTQPNPSGGKCKETDVNCAAFAERGECSSTDPSWMLINCPMSCKLCNRWPASVK